MITLNMSWSHKNIVMWTFFGEHRKFMIHPWVYNLYPYCIICQVGGIIKVRHYKSQSWYNKVLVVKCFYLFIYLFYDSINLSSKLDASIFFPAWSKNNNKRLQQFSLFLLSLCWNVKYSSFVTWLWFFFF